MSKRKLLLADDSITIQKVVNLTFADEGIEVIAVGDGDSAMTKINESLPDLILADVNMPGLSGYEICERIKQNDETKAIPVILLVGSFEPFDEAKAESIGANDYLTKPFQSIRQLVSKVTDLLEAKVAAENAADDSWQFADTKEIPLDETQEAAFGEPAMDDEMIDAEHFGRQTEAEIEKPAENKAEKKEESYYYEPPKEADLDEFSKELPSLEDSHDEEKTGETVYEFSDVNSDVSAEENAPEVKNAESEEPIFAETESDAEEKTEETDEKAQISASPATLLDTDDNLLELPPLVSKPAAFVSAPTANLDVEETKTENGEPETVESSTETKEENETFEKVEEETEMPEAVEETEPEIETVKEEFAPESVEETEYVVAETEPEKVEEVSAEVEENEAVEVKNETTKEEAEPKETETSQDETEAVEKTVAEETGEPNSETEVEKPETVEETQTESVEEPETVSKFADTETAEEPETVTFEAAEETSEAEEIAKETTEEKPQETEPTTESVIREEIVEATGSKEISPEMIEAIAQKVAEKLSDRAIREIAWEVVPQMTELIIKKMAEENEGKK